MSSNVWSFVEAWLKIFLFRDLKDTVIRNHETVYVRLMKKTTANKR